MLYLAAVAALATDLAARGKVLPGLTEAADGSSLACWRPVLAGPDALRARELSCAMPPLCRATTEAGEASAAVFGQALDALADAAVRARLGSVPGFTLLPAPVRGRSEPFIERWLAALTGESGELEVGRADTIAAAQLTFALWSWQDAAQEPPGPVRTCFRLIEPPPPDEPPVSSCRRPWSAVRLEA